METIPSHIPTLKVYFIIICYSVFIYLLEFQRHQRCHLILILILVELSPLIIFFSPLDQKMALLLFSDVLQWTECPTLLSLMF